MTIETTPAGLDLMVRALNRDQPRRLSGAAILWHRTGENGGRTGKPSERQELAAKEAAEAINNGKHLTGNDFLIRTKDERTKDESIADIRTDRLCGNHYLATVHRVMGAAPGETVRGEEEPDLAILTRDGGNRINHSTPKTLPPDEATAKLLRFLEDRDSFGGLIKLHMDERGGKTQERQIWETQTIAEALAGHPLEEEVPIHVRMMDKHQQATPHRLTGTLWIVEIREMEINLQERMLEPREVPWATLMADAAKLGRNG